MKQECTGFLFTNYTCIYNYLYLSYWTSHNLVPYSLLSFHRLFIFDTEIFLRPQKAKYCVWLWFIEITHDQVRNLRRVLKTRRRIFPSVSWESKHIYANRCGSRISKRGWGRHNHHWLQIADEVEYCDVILRSVECTHLTSRNLLITNQKVRTVNKPLRDILISVSSAV